MQYHVIPIHKKNHNSIITLKNIELGLLGLNLVTFNQFLNEKLLTFSISELRKKLIAFLDFDDNLL